MSNTKVKIALVEDERPILEMYRMKLEAAGFQVFTAENGIEGLKIIKEHRPDAVLLDLRMPEIDGYEMLKKLREQGDNTLVIILTNLSQHEAPHDLRFLKVEKYIVKAHSTPSQVVEEVNFVLKRYGKLARA